MTNYSIQPVKRMMVPFDSLEHLLMIQGIAAACNARGRKDNVLFFLDGSSPTPEDIASALKPIPKAWRFCLEACRQAVQAGCQEILFYRVDPKPPAARSGAPD